MSEDFIEPYKEFGLYLVNRKPGGPFYDIIDADTGEKITNIYRIVIDIERGKQTATITQADTKGRLRVVTDAEIRTVNLLLRSKAFAQDREWKEHPNYWFCD